jgi:methyl-accepting chemotaxis protein
MEVFKMRITILSKLIVLLLVVTMIPLAILGYLSYRDIAKMEETSVNSIENIGKTTVTDSTTALNNVGEQMIKLIAVDVAKQLEIYIKDHPEKTVADLQADPYFQSIAVQPVGKLGYTAITDVDTLICRFHKSPTTVNLDLHNLAVKLPGFWSVMEKTQGGKVSEGLYDWAEANGTINKKYMYIAVVNATTADGVKFSVAATTYISEFNAPVKETETKISGTISTVVSKIDETSRIIKNNTILFIVFITIIAVLLGIILARSIVTPIKKLTKASKEIVEGNLDSEMPVIKSNDEIKDLSDAVGLMVGAIKYHKQKEIKVQEAIKKTENK